MSLPESKKDLQHPDAPARWLDNDFFQVSSVKKLVNISGTERDREEIKVSILLY
jgi:hypothetical protein